MPTVTVDPSKKKREPCQSEEAVRLKIDLQNRLSAGAIKLVQLRMPSVTVCEIVARKVIEIGADGTRDPQDLPKL